MKGMVDAFKSIAIGGILFIIPVTVAVVVIGKVMGVLEVVAEPMADFLPTDTILGFGLAQVIAVAILLFVCFVAGLIARSAIGQLVGGKVEGVLLAGIPGYAVLKGLVEQVLKSQEQAAQFKPVLVPVRGGFRPAFEVERLPSGEVVVFHPSSPNVWSGFVSYLEPAQVRPLELGVGEMFHSLEQMGIGTSKYRSPDSPAAD
ncbi:MAG: DUF502 domain-containing protein [Gemmatimonadetes bacterium]|nr:DUF502 domain-containing protein [Gemmatimonadota bacterium]